MSKKDLRSMYLEEIQTDFKNMHQPNYRAEQVYKWVQTGATDFAEMTNISKDFRYELANHYEILSVNLEKRFASKLDETVKYLFRLNDSQFIESVLMKYKHGYSACVSTQVGCKMACSFCATGKDGFSRNLSASEMLSQIHEIQKIEGIRISNIVLMGMGEPLDNYDNVMRFLKLVSSQKGLNIGARHISISTCGLVDKIYNLANEKLQTTLSISLHAPNDEIRNKLMPINKKWNVDEIIKACKYYIEKTNKRILFEYAMIKDVNDSEQCAKELSNKLSNMICHVNLIPINFVNGNGYQKTNDEQMQKFIKVLLKNGLSVTIRRTLGKDINASCGQLRRKHSL